MTWQLYIDWDRNNDFTGTYDNVTADVCNDASIEWFIGCRPFQAIADESTLKFTVWNSDKKYSPENGSSPLFGKLVPNLPVQLKYSTVVMWTGVTKLIKPTPFKYGTLKAVIQCIGMKETLSRQQVYVDLYENVTADEVIQDIILGSASPAGIAGVWRLGVPGYSELGTSTRLGSLSDLMSLDVGVTTFNFVGDNVQAEGAGVSAYQLMSDLAAAEGGKVLLDRQGRCLFWNANHLPDDVTIELTNDNVATELMYSTPTEDLVNYIEVTCFPREESVDNTEILWQLSGTITIKAGDTYDIWVPFRSGDDKTVGARNIQTPAGADISFSAGTASVAVEAQGQRAKITLTNSGGVDAVCDTLILRGQTLASKHPIIKIAKDDTSIQRYGKYPKSLSLKALDEPDQAQDIADKELALRSGVLGRISSLTDLHQISSTSDAQIARSLGDMVRIKDAQLNHDRCYHIVGERHSLEVKNKMLTTTWLLEPSQLRLAYYSRYNQDTGVELSSSGNKTKLAQSFKSGAAATVGSIRLWLKRVGSPAGNLSVKIYADYNVTNPWKLGNATYSKLGTTTKLGADSSYPGVTLITNATSRNVSAALLETGYRWITFTFPTPPVIAATTTYWIVLETTDSVNASNYVVWGADASSPSYTDGEMKNYISSWKLENADACFEVYAAALS